MTSDGMALIDGSVYQPPIGDYVLIGDTRTAALCSRNGAIDWLCLPTFGSDPVFGRLVDGDRGGSFSITAEGIRSTTRTYRRGSAVLDTTWETASGSAVLTDAMILDLRDALMPHNLLVRQLRCTEGSIKLLVRFDPRRGLPGQPPRVERRQGNLVCSWGSFALGLLTAPQLDIEPGRETVLDIGAGDEITFILTVADRSPLVFVSPRAAEGSLRATDSWWRTWSDDISYDGPFRDPVVRSLITLRLLTFAPSGAPVAAPSTSLPEVVGGSRNWDYRFSWPRDASIGIAAFLAAGKHKEAHSFMHWLLHASRLTRPRLDVLYTIYGKPTPEEREVRGVQGYRGSVPVRIGNAASRQHQLDVYGWVVDAAWLLTGAGHQLHGETWRAISGFAEFVAGNWRRPDAGIWEVRGEPRHYVHSKLMAWLALDRALRIAQERGVRSRRLERWRKERDVLSADIRANGFDRDRGSYVWSYGSRELDAALLLLPVLEFDRQPSDRVGGTITAIADELGAGEGLLYRYPRQAEGMAGHEGAFLPCSFWLAQALARSGRVEEAKQLFERLLTNANDVGLFSEEVDPESKELLGNFPQAFTHATLIQTAAAMEHAQQAFTSAGGS